MDRRRFLSKAGKTGIALATLPGVVDSFSVRALAHGNDALDRLLGTGDRILVLIQMAGGNDGLNTIVPITIDKYYTDRPSIAIPKSSTLRLTDDLGWHPAMAGFRDAFDDGRLAVVQGVTYPNPDRSHFRGTDIWLTATDADVFASTGWMGRYLETLAPGYPATLPDHPLAIQIGTSISLGLLGSQGSVGISFRDPDEFYRLVNTGSSEEVPASPSSDTPAGREIDFMRNVARSANVYAKVVKQAADKGTASVSYPTSDLGAKLKVVAQLISGGLSSRIYLLSWAGFNFDTHANQGGVAGTHANLLRELSEAVAAFMADMKAQGHDDRIAGMTFSEFGRRVMENGSQGTDHGTAAPLFVFGKHVNGGIYGKHPSLTDLDDRGDMLMQHDYRDIYASVLLQWLGAPATLAQNVLFKDFASTALPLFKSATSVNDTSRPASIGITSIGPNPAVDHVRIRVDVPPFSNANVVVRDMAGNAVRTTAVDAWAGTCDLDVRGLPQGSYVVTLTADRQTVHSFLTVSR